MMFTDDKWPEKKKLAKRFYKKEIKQVLKLLRIKYPFARMRLSQRSLSVWIYEKIEVKAVNHPMIYIDDNGFRNKIEVGLL